MRLNHRPHTKTFTDMVRAAGSIEVTQLTPLYKRVSFERADRLLSGEGRIMPTVAEFIPTVADADELFKFRRFGLGEGMFWAYDKLSLTSDYYGIRIGMGMAYQIFPVSQEEWLKLGPYQRVKAKRGKGHLAVEATPHIDQGYLLLMENRERACNLAVANFDTTEPLRSQIDPGHKMDPQRLSDLRVLAIHLERAYGLDLLRPRTCRFGERSIKDTEFATKVRVFTSKRILKHSHP